MSDGLPILECPACGCKQFDKGGGTRRLSTGTVTRYITCRNPHCRKQYLEAQPPPRIIREVKPRGDDDERPVLRMRTA
jgi:hypothetical protein